jgi:hypothetical protein
VRRLRNFPWGPFFGVLIVLGIFGHCGYVYATCEGRVLKGYFDQPVCVTGDSK